MINNYIKTFVRNFLRNKVYSALNVIGLAIGMATAIFIFLWAKRELSIDRFHQNVDDLYIMFNRTPESDGGSSLWWPMPTGLGPTLKKDFPEVEFFSRESGVSYLFSLPNKKFKAAGTVVDSDFLSMFSFPLRVGSSTSALKDPSSIVLTESFAKRLYGDQDPMGKQIKLDKDLQVTVTGILAEIPDNTKFKFDYLLPWSLLVADGWKDNDWSTNSVMTYVKLKDGASQVAFDKKVMNIKKKYSNGVVEENAEVFTQNIGLFDLYNRNENGVFVAGKLTNIQLFLVIGVLILLIACINFMNLSTAKSVKRAKEVGIRKVVGVKKSNLIIQFITESFCYCLLSFFIALMLVVVCLPFFNELVGANLMLAVNDIRFWIFAFIFILLTAIFAGSYPSFYLSSFNPVKVLKGTFQNSHSALTLRKILVVTQFTIAIVLIISTIVISRQINLGISRNSGYDQSQLISVHSEGDISKNYNNIRNELLASGAITSISFNNSPITSRWVNRGGYQWEGALPGSERESFFNMGSDANFVKTMGLTLKAGRDIDIYNFPTDSNAVLINEAAAATMGIKDPIGKTISEMDSGNKLHIVGVINDFIVSSPFQTNIDPLIVYAPGMYRKAVIHLKLTDRRTSENLASIERIFKKFNTEYPFEYQFIDEDYANKFYNEQRTGKFVNIFSFLTIFISCLGLFGLAAYTAESRTQEIGIRKVLGASVLSVSNLLSREFLVLVSIAFLIASPIAWYIMNRWLEEFSYRTSVSWKVFALTGALSLIITLITVSGQSIRAALVNPVKSLRDE